MIFLSFFSFVVCPQKQQQQPNSLSFSLRTPLPPPLLPTPTATTGPRRLRAAHQERRALRLPALPPAPAGDKTRPGGPSRESRSRRRLHRIRRLPQSFRFESSRAGDGVAHQVEAAGVFPGERDQLLLPPLRLSGAGCEVKRESGKRERKWKEETAATKLGVFCFRSPFFFLRFVPFPSLQTL